MNIRIYGDSYADPVVLNPSVISYITQLANEFPSANVKSYGLRGTGPDYSLNKLRKHGGDLILFFTGFPERLPYYNIPHIGQTVNISDEFYHDRIPPNNPPEISDYINKHRNNLTYLHKTLFKSIIHRTEEIIAYLRYYSVLHNTRIIALPLSNPYPTSSLKTFIPQEIYDTLNTPSFTLYPYNLSSVSRKEFTTEAYEYLSAPDNHKYSWGDRRQNHLSQCNHDILFQNICQILEHEKHYPHKLHFISKQEVINESHSQDFIYDN